MTNHTIYSQRPFNAGTQPETLASDFITQNDAFFVRNHGDVPQIDPDTFRLSVGGMVQQSLSLSLAELQQDFDEYSVTAVLQCAGNRRVELERVAPIPNEIIWDLGAIGNASWSGVRLSDILDRAGIGPQAAHVAFLGLDATPADARGFGGSIPLTKAQQGEVLIAYKMNGDTLPPNHGYPLRVVVPGYIGARSVKWLSQINVQTTPSDNYFQQQSYRHYPPQFQSQMEAADFVPPMLGPLPVNAIIFSPKVNDTHPAGRVTASGVAVGQEGQPLERVEFSLDGGENWQPASLTSPNKPWAWVTWAVDLDLNAGEHTITVRAIDAQGTTQPPALDQVWNFKGYINNAYHQVRFTVA
jgi:sulfite oxidase